MLGLMVVYLETLMCCVTFMIPFPRRRYFPLRFPLLALLAGVILYFVSPHFAYDTFAVFIYYVIEFFCILAVLRFSFQATWWQAVYCAGAGWATQHIAYQILQITGLYVDLFRWMPPGYFWVFAEGIISYLPFCILAYFAFARRMDISAANYEKGNFRRRMSVISLLTVLVCIGITRLVKASVAWPEGETIADGLYAITCCLLCLVMQSEVVQRAKLTREMELVRVLWKEDSKRLAERRDTIELVNMKCHDIRHRLEDSRLPLSRDEVSELQSIIQIYDQTFRTGNPALDVLLADRALLCEKDHIQLSFLGDGTCLSFLTEPELFSLFSNALGNAMEAARGVEEAKRQISVIVRSSGDLVSISVTNYYQGELEFEDGLPRTTRPDGEDFHGYGMKSMRAIARKHGGKLKATAEEGMFTLTVWLVNSRGEAAG